MASDPVKSLVLATVRNGASCGCGRPITLARVRRHRPTGMWGSAKLCCDAPECANASEGMITIDLAREGAGLRRQHATYVATLTRAPKGKGA